MYFKRFLEESAGIEQNNVYVDRAGGVPWTERRSNQSTLKEINLDIHWKDWWWSWNSNTLATWCEELTHLKRPWCWERLKVGRAGDDRGWDGWMVSPTQWTWVWASSRSWWWTGKPGAAVLGVAKSWTWLSDWTDLNWCASYFLSFSDSVLFFLGP